MLKIHYLILDFLAMDVFSCRRDISNNSNSNLTHGRDRVGSTASNFNTLTPYGPSSDYSPPTVRPFFIICSQVILDLPFSNIGTLNVVPPFTPTHFHCPVVYCPFSIDDDPNQFPIAPSHHATDPQKPVLTHLVIHPRRFNSQPVWP